MEKNKEILPTIRAQKISDDLIAYHLVPSDRVHSSSPYFIRNNYYFWFSLLNGDVLYDKRADDFRMLPAKAQFYDIFY